MDDFIEIIRLEDVPVAAADKPTDAVRSDVYFLPTAIKTRIRQHRLRPELWQCLMKVNGQRDVTDIALVLGRSVHAVQQDLDRLALMGLVCEPGAISLQRFLKERGYSQVVSVEAPMEAASVEPVEAVEEAYPGDCSRPNSRSLWCLRKLVRERSKSQRQAELLLYQIFSAVPRRMFVEAGIGSYLFIDDSTTVQDPALMRALVTESSRVLKRDVCNDLVRCASH